MQTAGKSCDWVSVGGYGNTNEGNHPVFKDPNTTLSHKSCINISILNLRNSIKSLKLLGPELRPAKFQLHGSITGKVVAFEV